MYVRMLLGFVLLSIGFMSPVASATGLVKPLLQAAGLAPAPTPTAAADFELPDHRGNVLHLGAQRGKVVFINFWATWCPPCIHEMPMMEQLYQSLRQQSFAIWAVNMQESQEDVGRFMASKRFHFPALVDVEGAIASRYLVRGLPRSRKARGDRAELHPVWLCSICQPRSWLCRCASCLFDGDRTVGPPWDQVKDKTHGESGV